ncbi:hypothetical protein WOC76_16415 [Methylocystis sp. IM3]|uniref:hypothetical protein n=1 Tax=unclassified Methylocystis TaxID=2625913 RepID=UPI0030F9DE85
MRLLLLVFWIFAASLPGAAAAENARAAVAGESPRAAAEKQPELRTPPGKPAHFRCARKITLGPDKSEVACLLKRHNTYAGGPSPKPAPQQKETGGRDQDRRQPGRH